MTAHEKQYYKLSFIILRARKAARNQLSNISDLNDAEKN